jgi:hypothetical protein
MKERGLRSFIHADLCFRKRAPNARTERHPDESASAHRSAVMRSGRVAHGTPETAPVRSGLKGVGRPSLCAPRPAEDSFGDSASLVAGSGFWRSLGERARVGHEPRQPRWRASRLLWCGEPSTPVVDHSRLACTGGPVEVERLAVSVRRNTSHARLMAARHASAPLGSMVMSILALSIESTRHPSAKLALISSWVTRLGPQSPGWRSLKHNMW